MTSGWPVTVAEIQQHYRRTGAASLLIDTIVTVSGGCTASFNVGSR